jgi:parallel beta-helix repeat protein
MKNLFFILSAVAIFTLFLFPAKPLKAETTAHYFHDNFCVDLKIGDGGDGKKYELYRNTAFIYSWQNQTDAGVYYSDWPGAQQTYYYQAKYYTWNEGESQWDYTGSSSEIEVDTRYTEGYLHNNTEWQDKFGRGPIGWYSGSLYRVLEVAVCDGTLEIDGADVLFSPNEYGVVQRISVGFEARLHADGATFSNATAAVNQGEIQFTSLTEPEDPVIENSTLDDVKVKFSNCTGVEISNNTLVGDVTIQFTDWGEGNRIINNRGGGRISLFSSNISNCTVQGNQVDRIDPSGNSNTIQGNSCYEMDIYNSSGNQIIGNTVVADGYSDRIYVRGGSNNINIEDNELEGTYIYIESCDNNTIEGNTIEGGYIELWNSDTNTVKQNRINQSTNVAITLRNSSYNSIEDNNINYSAYDGIRIGADGTPCDSNVIVFNHVYGGCGPLYVPAGISVYNGDGNGAHENISEDYYYGVEVGTAATNSWVYNNLFRDNEQNAVDDGTNTTWNKPKTPVASNIVGGPYLGGNYWSDYTGTDGDGDKLGDTPYPIPNTSGFTSATDNLPLIWVSMPSPTPGPTPETLVIDSGDYNGDGTSDIAIFRRSSGLWSVRGITRVYFGSASDIPAPGDYSGDSTADIGTFRGSSGLWAIRGVTRAYFGSASDIPVPGDYDGDGSCDAGIFRATSGLWALRAVTRVYFGGSSDQPIPGDYDGDGTKDAALFRGSSGLWALRNISRVYFGSSSDTVVPGDFSGDGTWKAGVFRPSSGLWAIRDLTRSYFGGSSDQPIPANYGGPSGDDIAIFRSDSGLWAVRAVTRVYYGASGDIPVTR